MAVPSVPTATLAATNHRTEHARLVTRETTDLPRGIIAQKYPNITPAINGTATEVFRLTNVPVVTGRLYLFSMFWRAIQNTGAAAYINWKTPQTPSAVTGTTDLVIDVLTVMPGSSAYGHLSWQQMFRAPTGLITIVIQCAIIGSTGNLWLGDAASNGSVTVRDIGPNRGGQ